MVPRTKWIDRRFNFSFPAGHFSSIIERLRGTPARLEEIIGRLPAELLTQKPDHGWSIQENVGHLIEVETLHVGRLDDYDAGFADTQQLTQQGYQLPVGLTLHRRGG